MLDKVYTVRCEECLAFKTITEMEAISLKNNIRCDKCGHGKFYMVDNGKLRK